MKKLKLYVIEEVFKGFIPAFLALTLIMVLGFCLQLLHEGIDIVRLPVLLPAVIVYSVPLVLPSAFLTAAIMAFGRLSGDNEIVAIRVGGIPVFSVIVPVCALALLLSVLAMYFQFELVPKARRQMKMLQRQALKQILIEKVALSERRQLSLGNWHLQYDDFRDGKMVNLTLLQTEAGTLKTIITAAQAEVKEMPGSEGFVLFRLHDCVLTGVSGEEWDWHGSTNIASIELSVEVAKSADELKTSAKYLDAASLLGYIRLLREKVSEHPRMFRNPDRVGDQVGARMREIKMRIYSTDMMLRECREEVVKLVQEEKRKLERAIELKSDAIKKKSEELQVLLSQQAELSGKMEQMGRQEDEEGSYERMLALQKELREVKEKIEGHRAAIERLKSEIRLDRAKLDKNLEEAQDQQEQMVLLERERAQLVQQYHAAARLRRMAEVQDDLRSATIRVHKRLAMAVSVFIFALVGIPLGIMSRHHSMTVAFGISFAVVLFVFYPFLIGGQILAQAGMVPVAPALWAGNGVIFLIGSALMWRVVSE